jgi:Peptidase family M50
MPSTRGDVRLAPVPSLPRGRRTRQVEGLGSRRRLSSELAWVSLGWGIINLLPILPLDGGNIAITLPRLTRGVNDPDHG